MSNETKCSIMAWALVLAAGMHGAARSGSWYGYAVAAIAVVSIIIGLWVKE
ncbi:hypothetical protein LCGC14_2014790 [marine sediment metagenome]|uniref:Uncharacterized protein n=1 Tax=marine sediment metagenome TaxID=412755 RepID=A0A0F9HWH3_9ZZZZ